MLKIAIITQLEKTGPIVDCRDSKARAKLPEQEYPTIGNVVKKIGMGK